MSAPSGAVSSAAGLLVTTIVFFLAFLFYGVILLHLSNQCEWVATLGKPNPAWNGAGMGVRGDTYTASPSCPIAILVWADV